MTQPSVIFDMDGTLVDTAPGLIMALNHVLENENYAFIAPEIAKPMIGHGPRAMIGKALAHLDQQASETKLVEMEQAFMAFYAQNFVHHTQIYPGVIACLKELMQADIKLGVCTNTEEALAQNILDEMGLSFAFSAICGVDTFQYHKPHPQHLLSTITRVGSAAEHSLMVGDSETDIKTARNANVPVIGIPFGYSNIPLHQFEPDHVIAHHQELIPSIKRLKPSFFVEH